MELNDVRELVSVAAWKLEKLRVWNEASSKFGRAIHLRNEVDGHQHGIGEAMEILQATKNATGFDPDNLPELNEAEMTRALTFLLKRFDELTEEVTFLRSYGNKDCTAMADEALERERSNRAFTERSRRMRENLEGIGEAP